jgi:hypothetical protein
MTLTVPMPPNLANARLHWRAKDRERGAYFTRLDVLQLTGEIPPPPAAPLPRATIRAHMTLGAAMDDDNAVARAKWPIDWLVTRGYLASDRRTCLRWEAFPEQTVTRKVPAAITLTLTPAMVMAL